MKTMLAFRCRPLLVVLLVMLLLAAPLASPAQCVLCSTQVEAARQENDGYDPGGLNKGILYLMAIPYLLMSVVGYGWYQRRKRDRQQATPALLPRAEQTKALALLPH